MKHVLALGALVLAFHPTGAQAAGTPPLPGVKYSADKMVHHAEAGTVELIGNAKVLQGDKVLTGQKILLNLKTGAAKADGAAEYKASAISVEFTKPAT